MKAELEGALTGSFPSELVEDLADDLVQIRQDVAKGTLGRAAPGKFVETVVQMLQYLERGSYDNKPKVDAYLRSLENGGNSLPDGLRLCASRILRSMYTLRNKRNILHKGSVDPNEYDLRFLLAAAQWISAELVRTVSGMAMADAGALVAAIQAPVGTLVQDLGDRKLVHP